MTRIMVQTSDNPPLFMAAYVLEEPGPDSKVTLTEPIQMIDGTCTQIVDASLCFQYDDFLMDQCNRLVGQAMDTLEMVTRLIDVRAKPAFEDQAWLNAIDPKLSH